MSSNNSIILYHLENNIQYGKCRISNPRTNIATYIVNEIVEIH